MWKNSQVETSPVSASAEPLRSTPAVCAPQPQKHAEFMAKQQSVVGPGIVLVGDIEGTESLSSLYIEGTVEGNINLPGAHVIVGSSGKVNAGIVARNILVSGQITGNVTASDRLEIRAGGSLTGDASAPRVSVDDGALIHGSILVTSDAEELAAAIHIAPKETKTRKTVGIRTEIQVPVQVPVQVPIMVPALRSA